MIKEDPVGNKKLIAYFVASPESDLNDQSMRNYLIKHIPDFMVPSYFKRLDTLPKTESGKTDYKALPDPEWEKQVDEDSYKDAGTPTELQLIEIFERQLEIRPIGTRDNILDSGLDSLKLFVAFDTVEKHFKVKVDIDFLVETPTLEALGEYIDRQRIKAH